MNNPKLRTAQLKSDYKGITTEMINFWLRLGFPYVNGVLFF